MSKIEKSAGRFELTAWPDGFPASILLAYQEPNGTTSDLSISAEDLHDLKYVVKRMISDIEKLSS